jgi:S-adenosylmethionine:tRNA ribosyltransferase-isomerase
VALATDLFDYLLPPELVAQEPAARRDESRLLVVDRASRNLAHVRFADLPTFLRAGDRIFRNNATVIPARLRAVRPTGGQVECFLLEPAQERANTWRCLVKPGRKLPLGATFAHPEGIFRGTIVGREEGGAALVAFEVPGGATVLDAARRAGEIPLPPYIDRRPGDARADTDRVRYQTVYADPTRTVAVAAPTAGLHFTPAVLDEIARRGAISFDLTLHVGLGTFKPITTDRIEEHAIHRETYEIGPQAQAALFPPLPGRRIAIGTTTVRAVEDFLRRHEAPLASPLLAEAGLFLHPPAAFRGVDALLTNFHQPRSTLLCLLAAFLSPGRLDGIEWFRAIYAEAVERRYRFLSYGDAMLIL